MARGSTSLNFKRPQTYLYSGGSGTKTLNNALPTGGCYLRCECSDGTGSISVNGVATDASLTETISSFDASYVGISTKKWTSITSLIISGFTSVVIYPADLTGTKILLTSTTDVTVRGTLYSITRTTGNVGEMTENLGNYDINFKGFSYNPRIYTVLEKDTVTIDGKEYTVKYINNLTSEGSETVLRTGE